MIYTSDTAQTSPTLDGLANLRNVGGSLEITSNGALTNLDGLANISSVGDYLYIGFNPSLTNLISLANLTSVGDYLYITSNNDLTNLDGLANLTSVGDYLYITSNKDLTNLDGFANLTSVGGDMLISGNDALTNLNGLANLTSVGGDLIIYRNTDLTDLDGLANISSVGGSLEIDRNYIANCEGVALLLGWPDGPPDDTVAGDITIGNNGPGCDSVAQVLASKKTPPTISDRFNALMQTIQAIRGAGSNQQAQATSESPAGAEVARELAKEEGATVQARATGSTGEPESIPAMPYYLMLMMMCLVGLFGLRQLRD